MRRVYDAGRGPAACRSGAADRRAHVPARHEVPPATAALTAGLQLRKEDQPQLAAGAESCDVELRTALADAEVAREAEASWRIERAPSRARRSSPAQYGLIGCVDDAAGDELLEGASRLGDVDGHDCRQQVPARQPEQLAAPG